MDVIGFLCGSLGNSTDQLHDSLGSRRACACSEAGFSSQNGDRASVYYRKAEFCCAFLWAKGLNAKYSNKEMFPVYGGKCLSRKVVHNCVEKFSQIMPGQLPLLRLRQKQLCSGWKRWFELTEDNDRQCSNCTRVYPWFSTQHNAENVQANWYEGYCFIMTMPDHIEPE
jgi:hypothetical protein